MSLARCTFVVSASWMKLAHLGRLSTLVCWARLGFAPAPVEHVMRNLTLAAGIIVVGVLAALPFRRTSSPVETDESESYSSRLHSRQIQSEIVDEVVQWPERPGFDPSLAWQPQPMTLNALPRAPELPPMSADFPSIELEAPSPVTVKSRFGAVPGGREAAIDPNLLMPTAAQIKDNFRYSPPPVLPRVAPRQSTVQAASVVSNQTVDETPSTERQYIREPH